MPKQNLMCAKRGDLAKALVEHDLTGQQLGKLAGLGPIVVSRARQGRPVRRSAACAIAGALRMPVEALFDAAPSDAAEE